MSKAPVKAPTGFLWFSEETMLRRTLFSEVLRKLRRYLYGKFKKGYIHTSIATEREGECHRCGACCALVYRCPFLGYDTQKLPYCRIYGDLRPQACKNYPFDRIDSEIDQCGFKFKK